MTSDLEARVVHAARRKYAKDVRLEWQLLHLACGWELEPPYLLDVMAGEYDERAHDLKMMILGARAALAEIERDGGWRRGDTAPRDGTVFLTLWGNDPLFAGFIDGQFRILMPPARGRGFGIHGNYEPFTPEWWMPSATPPTSHPQSADQTEQA